MLGIELVDFQLKRINYAAEVQQDVFERMIAERQRIAQQYRSEGEGEAARIRGERERDLQAIQSEAYRQAEETRGVADAEATRIYADAYSRDGSFYEFIKSMETFETAIDPDTLLILTTDGELFQYLNEPPTRQRAPRPLEVTGLIPDSRSSGSTPRNFVARGGAVGDVRPRGRRAVYPFPSH